MKNALLSCIFLTMLSPNLFGQQTEFEPGLSHSIDLGVGARKVWQYEVPRSYFNTLHYGLNWTVQGNALRLSPRVGVVYFGNDLAFSAGLRGAFRLKTFGDETLGSTHNLHLVAEGWTVDDEIVAGGGVGVEIGKLIIISFKNLHDFRTSETWSLLNVGIILYKDKELEHENHH